MFCLLRIPFIQRWLKLFIYLIICIIIVGINYLIISVISCSIINFTASHPESVLTIMHSFSVKISFYGHLNSVVEVAVFHLDLILLNSSPPSVFSVTSPHSQGQFIPTIAVNHTHCSCNMWYRYAPSLPGFLSLGPSP